MRSTISPGHSSGPASAKFALAWPRLTALRATQCAATVLALAFAYGLMRLPVQISDSLEQLLDAQQSASVLETFSSWAHRAAYLRPMFYVDVKVLFDLANGHYWLAYRGFHALLACAALWLFVRALRVRTWDDFAAAIFALTVFTGLHTFRGLVREAFPVSHFLQVAVLCLLALNLARSRGGWLVDVAAAATFAVASLTIESGLLVWVVIVTAWACGMRGVSRRGILAVTALLGVYCWARFWMLSVGSPGFDQRSSGFLLRMLEPDEIQQRFGAMPAVFYAYNVTTSFLSVLFSEPDGGVFEAVRAWLTGDVPPRLYLAVASSSLSTALIVWAVAARVRGGTRLVARRINSAARGVRGSDTGERRDVIRLHEARNPVGGRLLLCGRRIRRRAPRARPVPRGHAGGGPCGDRACPRVHGDTLGVQKHRRAPHAAVGGVTESATIGLAFRRKCGAIRGAPGNGRQRRSSASFGARRSTCPAAIRISCPGGSTGGGENSVANAAARALNVPACLVIAGQAAGLLLAPFDRHPLWQRPELNLSEAAAVRDAAEIVRLIEEHSEDPNAVREVRPGLLADQAIRVTPLEAAVAAKDVEIARVLLVNGATMDAEVWNHLRCSADGDEMTEFLDRWRPPDSVLRCDRPPNAQ